MKQKEGDGLENVREWATAVGCACVVSAVLSMASPGGSGKKLLGMTLTLMTMCLLFRPFAAANDWAQRIRTYTFAAEEYENTELEAEVERSAKSVYAAYLEENLRRVLDGEGISYKSIAVMMDNSQDGCISIGQVEVIVQNEDVDIEETTGRIKELLRGYIGFDPVVTAQ